MKNAYFCTIHICIFETSKARCYIFIRQKTKIYGCFLQEFRSCIEEFFTGEILISNCLFFILLFNKSRRKFAPDFSKFIMLAYKN